MGRGVSLRFYVAYNGSLLLTFPDNQLYNPRTEQIIIQMAYSPTKACLQNLWNYTISCPPVYRTVYGQGYKTTRCCRDATIQKKVVLCKANSNSSIWRHGVHARPSAYVTSQASVWCEWYLQNKFKSYKNTNRENQLSET
jgi:hypothetical protein